MAQRTITTLIDDLTGKELAAGSGETVTFGLDGVSYELDVDTKTADKLRRILAPYAQAGRRRHDSKPVATRRVKTPPDPTAVRAWAASNGIPVSNRGRIPATVTAQYEAAGN